MAEPVMPEELVAEDSGGGVSPHWHARAMRSLADQLGVGNDFYFPLLTVIKALEAADT